LSLSCDRCGAAVDTLDGVGYEFIQADSGEHLCFNCEWDQHNAGIVAEGGEAWDLYQERWD